MKTQLCIDGSQVRSLFKHLLRVDGSEYMAYAFGRRVEGAGGDIFQVTELLFATGDDYLSRGPDHVRLSPWFQLRAKRRCQAERPDLVIQIHSHPFARGGWFSIVDDADFPGVAFDFVYANPDVRCGRWVWGRQVRHSLLEIAPPGQTALEALVRAKFVVTPAPSAADETASLPTKQLSTCSREVGENPAE